MKTIEKMQHVSYREMMKEAIQEAMLKDDRVFLMGEDVGKYGGCFMKTNKKVWLGPIVALTLFGAMAHADEGNVENDPKLNAKAWKTLPPTTLTFGPAKRRSMPSPSCRRGIAPGGPMVCTSSVYWDLSDWS